jgi:hypothetical protein
LQLRSGLGDYEQVCANSTLIKVDTVIVNVLTVDGLIKAKAAANREKDKPHLVELRALKEMLKQEKPDSEV